VHTTSDQELLSLMQSGDRRAFGELYRRYRRVLYSFCVRLLADTQAAEDAVHETFMKLTTGSAAIAQPAALKSWLYSVARNEALMTLRRRRSAETSDAESVWDDETPLSLAEKADVQDLVQSAVACLKVEYREVILLREFEGLSYGEIASVTGDSASAVKSRLFKARRALAEKLAGVWNEEREKR
jgi:RNA polymerase sigma-70 factor (ECF subfamily)